MHVCVCVCACVCVSEQHRADWLVDERVEKMKDIAREVALFRDVLERRRHSKA